MPKVKYSELEEAFQLVSDSNFYWLDSRTGEILCYSKDAVAAIEAGKLDDLPDWLRDDVDCARKVLQSFGELPEMDSQSSPEGGQPSEDDSQRLDPEQTAYEPNRYISIEQIPSFEAFQFMSDFAESVNNSRLSEELVRALRSGKPFRRFKDRLGDYPNERELWFEYESSRMREYIKEWARDLDIELDFEDVDGRKI